MMIKRTSIWAFLFVAAICTETAAAERTRAIVREVVDRQTIIVTTPDNRTFRLRLADSDAPRSDGGYRVRRGNVERPGAPVGNIIGRIRPGDVVILEFGVRERRRNERARAFIYTRSGILINQWLVRRARGRPRRSIQMPSNSVR